MKKIITVLPFFAVLLALSLNTFAQGQGNNTQNTSVGFQSLFSNSTGYNNTAVGFKSLFSNTTGYENSANGFHSLYSNTEGFFNTAHGAFSLFSNTTGNDNTAVGWRALFSNTTGSVNTATGLYALLNNTTGGANTAHGAQSLFSNTTGFNNTANGFNSLFYNSTGYDNTANGYASLFSNTTGFFNTAHGAFSLSSNTTGNDNTAVGWHTLYSNTFGNNNTANGINALYSNITGTANTANGSSALFSNFGGFFNTASGANALYSNFIGNFNTAFGVSALSTNTTGSLNTAVGFGADVSSGSLINATAIGFGAIASASNSVRIGNAAVTSIGGQVGWTTFSDGRYKNNIKNNVPGLEFITQLLPVTYTLNSEAIETKLHVNQKEMKDEKSKFNLEGKADNTAMQQAINEKSKIIYTGFVAQDVEKAAKKIGYEFSGVDKPKDDGQSFYGLRYDEFVVPLVKAVQELAEQNKELKDRLDKIEASQGVGPKPGTNDNPKTIVLSSAKLNQNIPNPARQSTLINYYIPDNARSAEIRVIGLLGETIKRVELPSKGNGQLRIETTLLNSGTYTYSLIIDGKTMDTKKMVLIN